MNPLENQWQLLNPLSRWCTVACLACKYGCELGELVLVVKMDITEVKDLDKKVKELCILFGVRNT